MFTDENVQPAKTPFAIFSDESSKQEGVSNKAPDSRPRLSARQADEKEEEEEGLKENLPPQAGTTASHPPLQERVVGGPLQPAQGVPYVPLEIQEAILDEDERSQERKAEQEAEASSFEQMPPPQQLPPPKANPNMTIALPSKEAFEEMAERMSTPFSGRRNFNDDYYDDDDVLDANTCAVQIISKNRQELLDAGERPIAEEAPVEEVQQALSPIMESSRENNYRSTSSSGQSSISHMTATNKSHWGNTQVGNRTASSLQQQQQHTSKTPGSMLSKFMGRPNELTSMSGYMADSSSARTPGTHLTAGFQSETQKLPEPGLASPEVTAEDRKRQKMSESFEDDQLEEMTGCIQGMMSQFKKDAMLNMNRMEAAATSSSSTKAKSSFLAESLVESFAAEASLSKTPMLGRSINNRSTAAQRSILASINEGPFDVSRAPACDVSSAPQPDISVSQCLDKTGGLMSARSPILEVSGVAAPQVEVTGLEDAEEDDGVFGSQVLQEELTKNITRLSVLDLADIQDPFDEALQILLLSRARMPVSQRHGYRRVRSKLPPIGANREVSVADGVFLTGACKGVGAYGKVFKAMKRCSDDANETIANMDVVLKVQKPACEWEFYACSELHSRLRGDSSSDWFMSIPRCYTYDDGSVFVSEHHHSTLLDVANAMSSRSKLEYEAVAAYFAVELLTMAERLREADMVHADIKPDNFLLQNL